MKYLLMQGMMLMLKCLLMQEKVNAEVSDLGDGLNEVELGERGRF